VKRDQAIRTLVGIRLGIGVGAWLTPRLAGRLFGLDPTANPQAPYLGRLFGARDAALAYGTLMSSGDAQQRWLSIGMACDLADAAAGVAGGRAGYLPGATTVLGTGTALAAAALGALALRDRQGAATPA